MPVLLKDRSPGAEAVVAVLVPIVFGVVAGVLLGVNEIAYLVISLLGILGGYAAGLEHEDGLEGFYRGLLGGLLFGSTILITNGLLDEEPEADLPDPETLLIVITAVLGAILGFLGARSRAKRSAQRP